MVLLRSSSNSTILIEDLSSRDIDKSQLVCLPTLSYRVIQLPAYVPENSFLQFALNAQKQHECVSIFEISAPSIDADQTPVSDCAVLIKSNGSAFLELNGVVSQQNKDSLSQLLELAEENGCDVVNACINRLKFQNNDRELKAVIASLISVGFSLVTSPQLLNNYFCLAFQI